MARTPGGTPAHCRCMPAHGTGVLLPSRKSLRNDPAGTATGAGRWRAGASAEAASPESTELCCARSRATAILSRATFAVVLAAPGLLRSAPACLPIFESGGAIVRVSWRRRLGRIAIADVVIGAAPRPLVGSPHHPQVHCAVEGVDWS